MPGGDTGSVAPGGRAPGGMESLLPCSAQAPPSVSQDAGGRRITTHLPAAFRKFYHVRHPLPRQQPCGGAGCGSQTENQRLECWSAACMCQNPRQISSIQMPETRLEPGVSGHAQQGRGL